MELAHTTSSRATEALSFVNKEYTSRLELVGDINRLGNQYGVTEEVFSGPDIHMLVCRNFKNKCKARITGIRDQKRGLFLIKRCELTHSCGTNQRDAMIHEIFRKYKQSPRCGRIVEELLSRRILTNYKECQEVVDLLRCAERVGVRIGSCAELQELLASTYRHTNSENLANTEITKRIKQLGGREHPNIAFCREFTELNPNTYADASQSFFFFHQYDFVKYLRLPAELKIYERNSGYLIMVLQYDPSNEPMVRSLFISDLSKSDSIKEFLRCHRSACSAEKQLRKNTRLSDLYSNFFIIEPNLEIIGLLQSHGVDFFLKTRSVCAYLEEDREEDPLSFHYFHECNYGDKELLKMDRKYYLRKHCSYPLFNMNNMPASDLEFVSPTLLSLPFFECLNSAIWYISKGIADRKEGVTKLGHKLPDNITDMLEHTEEVDGEITQPDLVSGKCWCGKFQEFLIPCCHVTKYLRSLQQSPFYYVSTIYLMSNVAYLPDLVPVVDVHPTLWLLGKEKDELS